MHEHVRQSNCIENIDDPTADAVGVAAWAWLIQQPTLTEEVVLMLHRITTAAQWDLLDEARGAWRTVDVSVGGRICPSWQQVPELMTQWLERWGTVPETGGVREAARRAHVQFEHIHPFEDGNGRTGRFLMWWHELQMGEEPTLIPAATKHTDYYPWFGETPADG